MSAARWGRRATLAAALYAAVWAANRSMVQVRGRSMEPVLWPGDRLLTVPAVRAWCRPGQVVVVADPNDVDHLVVKRLIDMDHRTAEVRGDAPDRSTDSRTWGRLPMTAVRRIAVARWPDLRTRLRRVTAAGEP